MAAANAPLLDREGREASSRELDEAIFGVEPKPHLLHEAVRAELNARRAGTRGAKSRGFVSGGRAKPWRQKGTGRARAGTVRAPQFTGGGVVFPPGPRSFDVKVNRKAYRAALRGALTSHAAGGTLGVVSGDSFPEPSTQAAAAFVYEWGKPFPLLVVASESDATLIKSFRNLAGVTVTVPSELEVAPILHARSLLVSEGALELVQRRSA